MSVPQGNTEIEIEIELVANYKPTVDSENRNISLEFSVEKPKEMIELEDGNYKIPLTIHLKRPNRKTVKESQESNFSTKVQREFGDINLKARMNSITKHVDFNSDAELVNGKCSKETITSVVSHISRTHSNAPSIITIKPSCFHNFESMMDTSVNYFAKGIEGETNDGPSLLPVKFNYKIPLNTSDSDAELNILYSRNMLPYPHETLLERINNILELRLKPFQDTINETKQAVFEILANSKKT